MTASCIFSPEKFQWRLFEKTNSYINPRTAEGHYSGRTRALAHCGRPL